MVSPLEYETIGLMGSNLGIGDLDVIARLNWDANDLGLDESTWGQPSEWPPKPGCSLSGMGSEPSS